ncbi:MAG: DUF29 family protein [Microcystaceae cyanobacterium]
MEELLNLKELLVNGEVDEALLLVEEMTEMSRDDKLNKISSYAKVLLLHLIKQAAEKRTTRSWQVSIDNAVYEIKKTNRRRKAKGTYLKPDEIKEALEDVYPIALSKASLEAFGGCYTNIELGERVDFTTIIEQAMALILADS